MAALTNVRSHRRRRIALPQDGIDAARLTDDDLARELEHLHETRHDVFLHSSDHALHHHTQRTAELEREFLRRNPERAVDPGRLRVGARARRPQPQG
jgi:hypothetical protein